MLTEHWPSSRDVIERFYRDFGLDGGNTSYKLKVDKGSVTSRRYILAIDGKNSACFSGRLEGTPVSSLPIAVSGLNDRWSACLYDRDLGRARPLGVLEGTAWATIKLDGRADLFIGHPVLVDHHELFVQLTQSGEAAWTLEIHNPNDTPVSTRFTPIRRFLL